VENHMPEVIIIDEIGTELEALAARTIAERGVQLVGTAHGNTLDNLLLNPTLSDLVGGISSVTLGDEEARRRGTQKTVLERKAPPTFDVVVEQQARQRILVHADVAAAVDALLRGEMPAREQRELSPDGQLRRHTEAARMARLEELRGPLVPQNRHATETLRDRWAPQRVRGDNGNGTSRPSSTVRHEERTADTIAPANASPAAEWFDQDLARGLPDLDDDQSARLAPPTSSSLEQRRRVIYPMGISRSRLEQVIQELGVPATVGYDENTADAILVLKSIYRKQPDRVEILQAQGKPVYSLRTGTVDRLREAIANLFGARPTNG
jgi:hypothetical protein